MRDDYDEKELEDALVNQITQFLLELGTGFSYVGRQVHLQVGEREFYIDDRVIRDKLEEPSKIKGLH